jgi:hypothetical protein
MVRDFGLAIVRLSSEASMRLERDFLGASGVGTGDMYMLVDLVYF